MEAITSNSVNSLSPAKLKELRAGPTIRILYRSSAQKPTQITYEAFPIHIATIFSPLWESLSESATSTSIKAGQRRPSVTITTSSLPAVQTVLAWMLSCCNGRGMQRFPTTPTSPKPLLQNYYLLEAASDMGVHLVSEEIERRIGLLLQIPQIHSEDIRAVYLSLETYETNEARGGGEGGQAWRQTLRRNVAKHVADRMKDRKLRAYGAYKTLREELPMFNQDLRVAFREMTDGAATLKTGRMFKELPDGHATQNTGRVECAPRRKAHQAKSVQSKPIEEAVKQYAWANKTSRFAEPRTKKPNPYRRGPAFGQQQQKTTRTLHCPVTRKAQQGRPAYASLSLSEIGVRRRSFVGAEGGRGSRYSHGHGYEHEHKG